MKPPIVVSAPSCANGIYVCRKGYQPVCVGSNDTGELIWEFRMKEPWQQKMFPIKYGGDFAVQWMFKSLHEKGFEWSEDEEA